MVMGWALGMIVIALFSALVLSGKPRLGGNFAFAPISAVYYPVETLPAWLQIVAWCTPSAYVFEGMRSVLIDNIFRYDLSSAPY